MLITRGLQCCVLGALFGVSVLWHSQAGQPPVKSDAPKLTAEGAKDALLKMMRSKAGQEISWFKGDVADKMAKMKIEEGEGGWYAWSAFHFHPAKAAYTLVIHPRPGARACIFSYKGSFSQKDGVWSATLPELVNIALQAGD